LLRPLVVANALRVGERRKRTTEAKETVLLAFLPTRTFATDGETGIRAWQQTLHLARAQTPSVYDSGYLELPLRPGLPLATLDDRLKAAARFRRPTDWSQCWSGPIAKLSPGKLIRVEVVGDLAAPVGHLPTIGDLLP
jgi:hypothetical protein